ncbi:MAG: hypothetical protein M3010_00860 [Candidatus Dormibacteraeota bacterium]|nr:hypothetical protein [Candidatus Dormibacteraeota bacterium]
MPRGPARVPADEGRPADDCPYERPFAEDFHQCPAYAARRFTPFDSLNRPLRQIWTCNFLTPRRAADKAHGYYGGCALGDAAARLAWVERIHKDRLDSVVRLQRETAALAQPYAAQIYAAKARQRASAESEAQGTRELESMLRQVEAEVAAFIDENSAEFEAASLQPDACKELMSLAIHDLVERRSAGASTFKPPDALLERFPPEVRPLLFTPATEA